jgi:hypothetical protein
MDHPEEDKWYESLKQPDNPTYRAAELQMLTGAIAIHILATERITASFG